MLATEKICREHSHDAQPHIKLCRFAAAAGAILTTDEVTVSINHKRKGEADEGAAAFPVRNTDNEEYISKMEQL